MGVPLAVVIHLLNDCLREDGGGCGSIPSLVSGSDRGIPRSFHDDVSGGVRKAQSTEHGNTVFCDHGWQLLATLNQDGTPTRPEGTSYNLSDGTHGALDLVVKH